MSKFKFDFTSAAASVAGLASNVTGATWTLTANNSGDNLAHLITIKGDAATDHSAKTAVITGTLYGAPQTETVNLPNGTATVTTIKYFSTVTSVVPSATIGADTMDIGWAAGSISAWHYPDTSVNPFNIGFGCIVSSGSPTYTVQHSYGDGTALDHPTVAGETTSQEGSYTSPVAAIRLKFTAAGGVRMDGIQAGA